MIKILPFFFIHCAGNNYDTARLGNLIESSRNLKKDNSYINFKRVTYTKYLLQNKDYLQYMRLVHLLYNTDFILYVWSSGGKV